MVLEDTIGEVLEDLNSFPEYLDTWKTLQRTLKRKGFTKYKNKAKLVDINESKKALNILNKLENRFDLIKVGGDHNGQNHYDRLLQLFKLKGDVPSMLDALADSGYFLCVRKMAFGTQTQRVIFYSDLEIFKELTKHDLFKRYSSVFRCLKKEMGFKKMENEKKHAKYNNEQARFQCMNIIKLSQMEGDVTGAIYILAGNGYKIQDGLGLTSLELKNIKRLAKELQDEDWRGSGKLYNYLYRQENTKPFRNFFSDLGSDEKRVALKSIINLDYMNNEAAGWLEKEYGDLLMDVSFRKS